LGIYWANIVPINCATRVLAPLDDMNIIDITEDEGLKYVAGYVAYRFKSTYPHLGDETRECLLQAMEIGYNLFLSVNVHIPRKI